MRNRGDLTVNLREKYEINVNHKSENQLVLLYTGKISHA